MPSPPPELGRSPILERGPLRMDRRSASVHCAGQPLPLSGQAYRLLLALAEAWPRTVSRSELLRQQAPPAQQAVMASMQAALWQLQQTVELLLALALAADHTVLAARADATAGGQPAGQRAGTRTVAARVWLLTADDDDHAGVDENASLFAALPGAGKQHLRFAGGHLLPADYVERLLPWLTEARSARQP